MKNVFKAVLFMLVLVLSVALVAANPVITPIADQSINEGLLLKIDIASTAPSTAPSTFGICQVTTGDSCIATAVSEITIGATKVNFSKLSDTTAQFNWTPNFAQSGTYRFNVSVSDVDSMTNDTFTVTVNNLPPQISVPSAIAFGGITQERSDPNHDTESRREVNVSATLTLTNSGEPISGLTGAVSFVSGFSASDIMVNFTLPKTSLATGESISFPVSVRVPQKLDAVNSALSPTAVRVASLTFSATPLISTSAVTASTGLDIKAENNLEIKNVKVRFDGSSKDVNDDDTVKDMKPGQAVEFEIEVENKFKSKEDVTIEDVEVSAVSNDRDLDIDESDDVGDLSAEDTETVKLSAVIDESADDGTYSVEITADGTDEFGAKHGERWIIYFDVSRKSHEIAVSSMSLNPPAVSCEKQTLLSVNIKNIGRRDEDEVYVRVAASELSFGAVSDKLSVDKDDSETVTFNIPMPASIAPGTYRITADSYYNTGTKSNSDVALLSVSACQPVVVQPPVTQPPTTQPNVTVVTIPPNVTTTVPPAAKKSFFETPQYLALLVLGYVIVIGGGAAFIIKLLRK